MKNKKVLIVFLGAIIIGISVLIPINNNKEIEVLGKVENVTNSIIPKPLTYKGNKGKFIINKDTTIFVNGKNETETEEIGKIAEYLKEKLKPATGYDFNINKNISSEWLIYEQRKIYRNI